MNRIILFFGLLCMLSQIHSLSLRTRDRPIMTKPAGPMGTCGLERCGVYASCDVASLPSLKPNPKLPDPFTFINGTSVTTKEDWICRREEISAQLQHYELGQKPPRPPIVTGTVTPTLITVIAGFDKNTVVTFYSNVTLPPTGIAPYPVIIALMGISLNVSAIQARGVAIILFNSDDIGQQDGPQSRGIGKFFDLYGKNHSAGAMIAWSWGVSRMIDVLEESGSKLFDLQHIGVTGCSRNGKGTIVVAAFDERIALALPQESGSGGAASWRISDFQNITADNTVQTLAEITGENVWFTQSFAQFNHTSALLPFDHHLLHGLIAPRGLLIIENPSTWWGGNFSCWVNSLAGHTIYQALSIDDHSGVSQIGGHSHCNWPGNQEADVQAFIGKFLLGDTRSNTSIIRTSADWAYNKSAWIDWKVPILK